jgi:structural hemagglutinin/hemolysin toxin protein RtxA
MHKKSFREITMLYKICFYAPTTHSEAIKHAIFATGAGKIGQYSHCCWQVLGEGQYMPLSGSNPFQGTANQVEKAPEYKIELVATQEQLPAAIAALKAAHPYEEPAYHVIKLEDY